MKGLIVHRYSEIIPALSLPVTPDGRIYWKDYESDIERTIASGLPKLATCMDTTQVHGLNNSQQKELVEVTAKVLGKRLSFIAGVMGKSESEYIKKIEVYEKLGAQCIIFPPEFLCNVSVKKVINFYLKISNVSKGNLLAFELSPVFVPGSWMFSPECLKEIMRIPKYVGMKHSSLNIPLLLQLGRLRDRINPEFKIYSGDDYNIGKSIIYGFDCLLGAATLFPDKFALLAKYWLEGKEKKFYDIETKLQLLIHHVFEHDIKAYRYSINKVKQMLGWYKYGEVLPEYPKRSKEHLSRLANLLKL